MSRVNVVTSDRGWILERLAQEIARRLPYVSFGDGPDPAAAIQYYVTYSCRRRRLSPVEVAFFAHLEPEGEARDRFFAAAREVEHCVTMCGLYESVLREAGVEGVTTIPPGMDLEAFQPRLRIGVVGRTYHTGRKGEHVVAGVMDIPEIEWSFTGDGWPGPALHLPDAAMPDFYRSLDYVLVPSLYEGGPMCVTEALACGTEVIAPAIGWVPDFPHVEFEVGNTEDLRRVLLSLVERKRALRASVLDRSWDRWAEGHDRLFRRLAAGAGLTLGGGAAPRRAPRPARAGLFLHGNEARSQGGPTVRVPRLARELRDLGIEAEHRLHPAPGGPAGFDLVHAFNAWSPVSALDLLRKARRAGAATVFSPIFLDLSRRDLWQDRLLGLFERREPGAAAEAALAAFREAYRAPPAEGDRTAEPVPGFHAAVREMASLSDALILLSERERQRLSAIGVAAEDASIVRNAVDAPRFAEADPALFRAHAGLDDFVLCVARIEPRKNQLMLIQALRDAGLPVVLVGHAPDPRYRALVERHAFPGLRLLDRLPPNSPLLASAFAAARVAVLPSWSEGAPLAALEAAAAGASLVLSDESGESEYFGALARYCDPADPGSIRRAVLDAWETRRAPEEVLAQKDVIARSFGWDGHAAATEAAYARALEAAAARRAGAAGARPAARAAQHASQPAAPLPVIFDVTTTAHHAGRWTGIARVEAALALALADHPGAAMRFVTWNNKARAFAEVPADAIRSGRLARLLAHFDEAPVAPLSLPEGAPLVVAGSAWMQNATYAESVVGFAREHRLRLAPVIHDIIPARYPFWFDDGYAPVFEANLALLLGAAAQVVAVSEATRRDVEAHAASTADLVLPEVSVIREGDEIHQHGAAEPSAEGELAARFARRPFVLTVGAIHQRKNHKLLYDAWLRLAERMGPRCPHLVIVGGVAWNGQEVARALRGDPRLRDHVSILEGVDDAALGWLYANCLFTVYPSLHEGWGLPVAESLRHGKACLAADTSSVPEIAPGLVELLDPLDVMAWVTRIQFLAGSRAARAAAEARIAAGYRARPWSATAGQLLDALRAAPPAPARPGTPGAVLDFSDRVAANRVRGSGWHPTERWGAWSRATDAELLFGMAAPAREAQLLAVQARALSFPGAPAEIRVLANGVPVARWSFRTGDARTLHAVIPAEVAAREPNLHVVLRNACLVPLRQVTRNEDARLVGIGVARAALAPLSSVRDAAEALGPAAPRGPLRAGHRHALLRDPAAKQLLVGDWVGHAAWGMVPRSPRPQLELAAHDHPGRALEVALRLRPVATAEAPLDLAVLANGAEVASWRFASDAPATVAVTIPAAIRSRGDPIRLDLVAGTPRSPAALGLGAGEESFGFGLIELTASPGRADPGLPRIEVEPGGRIAFKVGGTVEAGPLLKLLGPDWHAPEESGTWSFGPAATLPLRLRGAVGAMLRASLEPYRAPAGGAALRLTVSAGGRVLARRSLPPQRPAVVEIPVPSGIPGPGGELDLTFALDAALSPFGVAGSRDERPLGLRLTGLEAAELACPRLGEVVSFAAGAGGPPGQVVASLLGDGWFAPEPAGRWSRAEGASLELGVAQALAEGARIFALVRTAGARPDAPAEVELGPEGAPERGRTAGWTFRDGDLRVAELPAPAAGAEAGGTLRIRRDGAATLRELGLGEDTRRLGVLLRALVVLPRDAGPWQAAERFAEAGLGSPRPLGDGAGQDLHEDRPGFALRGEGTSIRLRNWWDAEPGGRWSHDEGAEIHIHPPEGPAPARLVLELDARVHGTGRRGPAEVELCAEDTPPRRLRFETDEFVRQRVEFDLSGLAVPGAALCLRLRRPGAMSPAEAGEDPSDHRRLGLMIRALDVVWG